MGKFDPMNLTEDEIKYITAIANHTRELYIKENEKYFYNEDIEKIDERYLISKFNVENEIIRKEEKSFDYSRIEYVFEEEVFFEILKALTLREKLVLFLYYLCGYTDKSIGDALSEKRKTIGQIRRRTIKKISDKYKEMKGEL